MIFNRTILVLVACLLACVHAAPISSRRPNDVNPATFSAPAHLSERSSGSGNAHGHASGHVAGHAAGHAPGHTASQGTSRAANKAAKKAKKDARKAASLAKHTAKEEDIREKIDRLIHPGESQALFWSGTGTKKGGAHGKVRPEAEEYAEAHNMKTIATALKDAHIKIPGKSPHATALWEHASKVWADRAHGKVVALVGSKVRPESIYNKIEKPALIGNGKVTEFVEHNLHTEAKTPVELQHLHS